MQAYLVDGPANGRVIQHPNLYLFRLPLPKSFSVTEIWDAPDPSVMPDIPIANYQFTGQATVNMKGEVQYMIYRFIGMDA